MSKVAITVENLSKRYVLGEVKSVSTLWDILGTSARNKELDERAIVEVVEAAKVGAPGSVVKSDQPPAPDTPNCAAKSETDSAEELWALKDVTFEITQGQILGIIGRNGAGKSTLLKILSRITDPTEGRAIIRGRVGSLLEVGTGFHPELTGKENIFLNGAILGMTRSEIERRYDDIVEFSEIGRFIQTPVKRYSSGMFTRLAFSVAANLEPEILIIDEVLAVGDASFQKKCLAKIHKLMRGGRTVLFVSHSMSSVAELCNSAILLHKGRLVRSGSMTDVIGAYSELLNKGKASVVQVNKASKGVELKTVCVSNDTGKSTTVFDLHDEVVISIVYEVLEPLDSLQACLTISRNMIELVNTFDTDGETERLPLRQPGTYKSELRIPGKFLKAGSYSVRVSLGTIIDNMIDIEGAMAFTVEEMSEDTKDRGYRNDRLGHVICPGSWRVDLLS